MFPNIGFTGEEKRIGTCQDQLGVGTLNCREKRFYHCRHHTGAGIPYPPVETQGKGTEWKEPEMPPARILEEAQFRPISPQSWEIMSFASSQGNLIPSTLREMISGQMGGNAACSAKARQNTTPSLSSISFAPHAQPGEGEKTLGSAATTAPATITISPRPTPPLVQDLPSAGDTRRSRSRAPQRGRNARGGSRLVREKAPASVTQVVKLPPRQFRTLPTTTPVLGIIWGFMEDQNCTPGEPPLDSLKLFANSWGRNLKNLTMTRILKSAIKIGGGAKCVWGFGDKLAKLVGTRVNANSRETLTWGGCKKRVQNAGGSYGRQHPPTIGMSEPPHPPVNRK